MNSKLRNVLKKRYEAEIEDAKYKIQCYSEHELVIPEHPDITAEVDKLLLKMAEAEDKLAVKRSTNTTCLSSFIAHQRTPFDIVAGLW